MINNKILFNYLRFGRSTKYDIKEIISFDNLLDRGTIDVKFKYNYDKRVYGVELRLNDIKEYISSHRNNLINQILE